MSTGNDELREGYETEPPPSEFDTRENMMPKDEVQELGEERGTEPEFVAERAEQEGKEGYQPGGDPGQRADMEGGPAGRLKAKNAQEYERTQQVDSEDRKK